MNRSTPIWLAIVLVMASCAPQGSGITTNPQAPPGDSAMVVRVFDGDSFSAEVNGSTEEIRLLGINAPEGTACHGDTARDRLRQLLEPGDVVLVADGGDKTDRFGRLLRTAYAAGVQVNATLVAEGHALALQNGDPGEAELVALGDEAYESRLGMWAESRCGDATATLRIVEVQYDPPGRDFENANAEWVTVRNDGDEPIAIGGWLIRDESSSNRFEFPRGERIDPGEEITVRTGCGDDSGADRYWCADSAVWSNGGDTVILQTADGTVVDRLRYAGDF